MEVRDYLAVLGRRKALFATVLVTTVAVAVAITWLSPAKYTATSTLRIQPGTAFVGGTVRSDDLLYVDRLENTYANLATNREVLDAASRKAGLSERPDVDVQGIANTELMNVTATTDSPRTAAAAANALAAELVSHVRTLNERSAAQAERSFNERASALEEQIAVAEDQRATLEAAPLTDENRLKILKLSEEITSKRTSLAALRSDQQSFVLARQARAGAISLVAPAALPSGPSNRHVGLALALALVMGLVAATGLAFLAENLTVRFRTSDEMEQAVQAPVLAAIPDVGSTQASAIFNSGSKAEDAFRRLATSFLAASANGSAHAVVVTSAEPNQGTSTVVANLGRTLAQSGRSVLVVDANLRTPMLHEIYGLPNEDGVSDFLSDSSTESEPSLLPTSVPRLWMVPAGTATRDPAMLLGSPQMERWVLEVGKGFDYVLFDSPAVLAVTDALALARNADAILLVTRPDAHRERLSVAHRELHRLNARFLGIVVNKVPSSRRQFEFFEEVAGVSGHGVDE
jgi:capsular exopolysaccharide synthesis family protein